MDTPFNVLMVSALKTEVVGGRPFVFTLCWFAGRQGRLPCKPVFTVGNSFVRIIGECICPDIFAGNPVYRVAAD